MIRTLEDKKWVKVGEAEFQLRFISRREWRRISAGFSVLNFESGSEEKKVESSLKLMDYYSELIKLGVCSHKGIIVDGKDYPFQLVEDKVSDSLVDFYDLNKFLVPLGAEIIAFNSLTDSEKKN